MYQEPLTRRGPCSEESRPKPPFISLGSLLLIFSALVMLGGCDGGATVPPVAKPVKVFTVANAGDARVMRFPGEVRARTEWTQAFRVGGRMTDRLVNVGEVVQMGQLLARLDPADQQLGADAAQAEVIATRAALSTAQDDLSRAQDLHRRQFVSQASLDRHQRSVEAAQARVSAASAKASLASRGVAHTQLRSAATGVVKAILAEPGQVLAAGQSVLELARLDELEVHLTVAEDQVALLRQTGELRISLWAVPDRFWSGRLREVAPVADSSTRTYAVRITFESPDPSINLGMSASVSFTRARPGDALRLPVAALVRGEGPLDEGRSSVWVVDASSRVVRTPVRIDGFDQNTVRIVSGLTRGQQVVIAGANSLYEGQLVVALDPS